MCKNEHKEIKYKEKWKYFGSKAFYNVQMF